MRVWVAIVAFAAIGWAEAATFYVDSETGRDDPSRNGGASDPWQTITYALSRASGENTFLCRGTFEEEVTVAWEDRRSVFTANPDATLVGWVNCEYETGVDLNGFDVYGYAAGGSKSGIKATGCYFNNPPGRALGIDRFYGGAWAEYCLIEDCASVCGVSNWEFGGLTFRDCEVKDCGTGMRFYGEATTNLTRCTFTNVAGTVFQGSFYGEGATFNECEFYDCETVIVLADSSTHGYWGEVKNSVFRTNTSPLSVRKNGDWATIEIKDNIFSENRGTAITLEGLTIKLRRNVVKDNAGHGVYIADGDPDLGTPSDPGGNTFAGNASGYDVYNASPEDIMAYGNTWDAQTEEEMRGKTWEMVNVTRIYDHWDNPSFGYVRWSAVSALRPASVGQVKASFAEVPAAPAGSPEATATEN